MKKEYTLSVMSPVLNRAYTDKKVRVQEANFFVVLGGGVK